MTLSLQEIPQSSFLVGLLITIHTDLQPSTHPFYQQAYGKHTLFQWSKPFLVQSLRAYCYGDEEGDFGDKSGSTDSESAFSVVLLYLYDWATVHY
jgi:hypothetical protein